MGPNSKLKAVPYLYQRFSWNSVSILSYIFKILFANKTTLTDVDLVKEPIDRKRSFGGLFQNLGNSDKCKELYKSLMVKVHPDKFSGTDKEVRASELSQELGKYKHNYSN